MKIIILIGKLCLQNPNPYLAFLDTRFTNSLHGIAAATDLSDGAKNHKEYLVRQDTKLIPMHFSANWTWAAAAHNIDDGDEEEGSGGKNELSSLRNSGGGFQKSGFRIHVNNKRASSFLSRERTSERGFEEVGHGWTTMPDRQVDPQWMRTRSGRKYKSL